MSDNTAKKPNFCLTQVGKCSAQHCVFNESMKCNARAITMGEGIMSKCDTFMPSLAHISESGQRACVGACKVKSCAFNDNFNCTAREVRIGKINGDPGCLDYVPKIPW